MTITPLARVCAFALLLWPRLPVAGQDAAAHLMSTPAIHGDRICFSSEGDLWLGSISSGAAQRITTDEGDEYGPRFSPDGKWIAFTGQYDGQLDVYVMPAEGGSPRRLTYDPTGAEMVGWTPDGAHVLFRSSRQFPEIGQRLYLVPAHGGLPEPLPMEKAAQGAYAPDGKRLAFCRLALEHHRWKRYRGGMANHVWIADLPAKTFHRIDNDTINEQYPTWAGDSVFFVSERDGTANLWRYDARTGKANRVTSHDEYDVKSPDTDGRRVIYVCGSELWLYDIAAGKDTPIKLRMASDRIHARRHLITGAPGDFSLGPTGKRLLVETRGQLATAPAEKGEVRAIAEAIGTRSQQATWSPDGKSIAFVSDRSGEQNIWIAPADGAAPPRQLTSLIGMRIDRVLWSPDSKQIAYSDEALTLYSVDVTSRAVTAIAHGEWFPIGDFRYSPDSAWIAYSRSENLFVTSLYLYNVGNKQTTRLTFPPTRDHDPVFDPAGKYLYFASEREARPRWDAFDFQNDFIDATKLYALTLAVDTVSPLPVQDDEEGDAGSTGGAAPAKPTASLTPPVVRVDADGVAERITTIPVSAGDYSSLEAVPGKLLYLSRAGSERTATLKAFDFSTRKEIEIAQNVQDYALSNDLKKIAVLSHGAVTVTDSGSPISPSAEHVDFSGWQLTVDPTAEWRQIFEEAWRNQRDIFYDPHVHGQDWGAVRRKYEALLPAVGSRHELNEIIGDMQGEVNVSHEFNGGGYDRLRPASRPRVGGLGADIVFDNAAHAFRIGHLLRGDGFDDGARSPLLTPGLKIKEGDYLLEIHGARLDPDTDPNALLVGLGGKVISLRVNDRPTLEGSRTVRIRCMEDESSARYHDWVQRNRGYVLTHGGAGIAYIHVPDMSERGIAEFSKQFYAYLDRDGIILDCRYNHGGVVSGQILERLRRVIFEYDQPRYGQPQPYHRTAYLGRVVAMCNERTQSDGEYFCTGFRYEKLGPTVGTRTWGGFMAVNDMPAIDGGFVSTPVEGSFTPEGKWLPDGYGFNPDYVVDEDPNAFAQGRDPQLDKAIEVLKEEIRKDPPHWPSRLEPPYKEKAFPPNRP